jgi:threonine/homoserine/homoserine lactone efflux protein
MSMAVLGTENLGMFIAAGLLLNITPGADMLFIASRSAAQGPRAGIVAALGIGAGCLVHILGAALGLSVVLATSALAFTVVKYAGAAYLIYLGIASFLSIGAGNRVAAGDAAPLAPARIFRQAMLINALNPKVALFFMALLPQFVSPAASHPSLAFLFLGAVFNFNGTVVNVAFALLSSQIAVRFRQSAVLARLCKAAAALLFVGLGIRLAMTAQK